MGQLDDVQAFVERSRKARSLKELDTLLDAMTHEIGFDYYALVQHVDVRRSSNREAVWLENYPSTWAEAFVDRGLYASDPILLASETTSTGFRWSDVGSLIRLTTHHKRVLTEAAREGMGDGFTVPVHLPGDSNGTCNFAVHCGKAFPKDADMVCQLVGTFAFEAARKTVRRGHGLGEQRPRLTPRQLECILLISRGKSDWEIGQILGLKESTVRDYVVDACDRYGVHKRIQLVVRTLHDGQLTLAEAIG